MSSEPALPTTSRVRLRSATRDDLEAYVRLETDPEVRRYIGGPSSAATVAAIRASTPTPRWGRYVVASTETDQLIGTLFLKRDRDELEVGYLFLPEYWGRGLAFEALEALLGWVSESCTDKEIIAVTQTANERSMRLLDRLGFKERERFEEFGAEQAVLVRQLG
jgi:RimJ/RimL family protein N-acetyltransferase